MKKITFLTFIFIGLLFCSTSLVSAQGVGINSSGNPPDPSAILDVSSTTRGFVMPRMTTGQRDAISSPIEGLQIFNTTTKCFEAYVNNVWSTVSCPCPPPAAPASGAHTAQTTQITWNWNAVSGVIGYKYNTVNTYSTATDNGTSTSYIQTGLICGTSYTLYIWAYSICGYSTAATLTQTTHTCCTDATGGTITHVGGYTIHTFTSSGTFSPNCPGNIELLVVAGGGGGGSSNSGGGGAGGLLYSASTAVTAQAYTVTVGGGGAGGAANNPGIAGSDGENSSFASLIIATGGGGGGIGNTINAKNGGSGGGSGNYNAKGTGIPGQGNDGGGPSGCCTAGSGGGGAGGAGSTATGNDPGGGIGGTAGVGVEYSQFASVGGSPPGWFAGGGGGAGNTAGSSTVNGGGGAGAVTNGIAGTANTGGGGGGSGLTGSGAGGNGGSGIVIIRYPTP